MTNHIERQLIGLYGRTKVAPLRTVRGSDFLDELKKLIGNEQASARPSRPKLFSEDDIERIRAWILDAKALETCVVCCEHFFLELTVVKNASASVEVCYDIILPLESRLRELSLVGEEGFEVQIACETIIKISSKFYIPEDA